MTKDNLIKRVDQVDDEGDDFTVGTIKGLEPIEPKVNQGQTRVIRQLSPTPQNQPKGADEMPTSATATPKKEEAKKEEVKKDNKPNFKTTTPTPEQLEGTVMLKLRKQYAPLVEIIDKTNNEVLIQEFDTHYQLNAKQIRVSRQDAERILGKLNDGQWRVLFMNKKGEVVEFSDYLFVIGVVEANVEETKELAQINTRIDSKVKMDMDEIRDMLSMTQAKFLEVAISEYVQRVRAEML